MTKKYIAIIEVSDGKGYNDIRALLPKIFDGLPNWVQGVQLTESTTATVPSR